MSTPLTSWLQKYRKWWIPVLLVTLIKLFSMYPLWVERYYSTGFYPLMATVLRFMLGWLPFSLGDIFYGLVVCWLIKVCYRFTADLFRKRINMDYLRRKASRGLRLGLWVYIIFNILWGLNYNRPGIAQQLNLQMGKYTTEDLQKVNGILLAKTNDYRAVLTAKQFSDLDHTALFNGVAGAYAAAGLQWPFLHYRAVSIKPSFWGWLGNYTGFLGYYNPFSGEAQVNTTLPKFLLPFTGCHEVGHQLGYARENEANFAAYLTAARSPDTLFRYSAYLDLFLYANRNLYAADSASANQFRKALSPLVRQDLETWRRFNLRHRNPFEPLVRWVYGLYLRSNQQPSGLLSYDEVTAFIIAWYRKYGSI